MNGHTPGEKPLLLLVEDEPDTAALVKQIMECEGYQVVYAADGRDAVDKIALMPPPSLVFLDIQLPHVDGVTILNTIRTTPDWSTVPVVMLTAVADEQCVREVFSLNVQDYVLKPFKRETLVRYVEQFQRPPTQPS